MSEGTGRGKGRGVRVTQLTPLNHQGLNHPVSLGGDRRPEAPNEKNMLQRAGRVLGTAETEGHVFAERALPSPARRERNPGASESARVIGSEERKVLGVEPELSRRASWGESGPRAG